MYKLTASTLAMALLAGCLDSTAATETGAAPSKPLTRTAQKLADGTCGARLLHDSLIESEVAYGSFCPVPEALRTPHADGSLPSDRYGAPVVYQTWTTSDGDCEPRAWAIANVVAHAGCFKPAALARFRWTFDSAYKVPPFFDGGM